MPELLLLALLGASGAPHVYRWENPDGSIHFSDRPAGRHLLAARVRAANVIPAMPALDPGPRARLPAQARRAHVPLETPQVDPERCRVLRDAVQELWRQRRSGYRAGEGQRLRAELHARQAELKAACGVWR